MGSEIVPSVSDLHRVLSYDPSTGLFKWKERGPEDFETQKGYRVFLNRHSGRPAMNVNRAGYRCGRVFGVLLQSHRVAWAMHYGEWPDKDVDHINQVKSDNRIDNLRLATRSENLRNIPMFSTNTSGYKGVSMDKGTGKWMARVSTGTKYKSLGLFETKELAAVAYIEAAKHYHGEYFATKLIREKDAPT